MGLFSGGNSRSTTEVFNTTQNTSFNDLAGGNAASIQGEGNVVQFLDNGAINRAFNFAEDASGEAFSFAEVAYTGAIDVVSDVAENAGRQTRDAVAAVAESTRTGAENIVNQLGTYAAWAFAGYLALKFLKG